MTGHENRKTILDHPGGPSAISVLEEKEGGKKDVAAEKRQRDAVLLALKVGKGAVNPRMQAASSSWAEQGNGFSPTASRRERSPADTEFSPVIPCQPSNLQNYKVIYFLA